MRKRELDKFKKMLVLEKQTILRHLEDLEDESESQMESTSGDAADLASVEITQAAIAKLGGREKKLLKKIDYALQKIESGEFGVCEHCGEAIPSARLEARPVAQYCIDCKTELEQNERRYGEEDEEDKWGNDIEEKA